MNVKYFILFLILIMMAAIVSSTPINEYTLPYLAFILFMLTIMFVSVLFYKYIVRVFRLVKFRYPVECELHQTKYIICREKNMVTGVLWLKAIPLQPITMMKKEDRDTFIEGLQGLLTGIEGVGLHFISVRDVFGKTVIDYLKSKLALKEGFASISRHGPSTAMRSTLESIRKAIEVLMKTPLVQGYYLISIREIGDTAEEVKQRLENKRQAIAGRLATASIKLIPLEGDELENVLSAFFIGPLFQRRIT